MEEEVELVDYNSGRNQLMFEIPVSEVQFTVENYNDFEGRLAYILFNEEKVPVNESGESEKFGPVITDGSQEVNIVVDMPWGEVETDSIVLDASHISHQATLFTKEHFEAIKEKLKTYGEEVVQASANENNDGFTVITDRYKDLFNSDNIGENYYYAGKFIGAAILEDFQVNKLEDEYKVTMDTQYQYETDIYRTDSKPKLRERTLNQKFYLVYDEKEENWLIDIPSDSYSYGNYDDAIKIEGSKELYETDKKKKTEAAKADVQDIVDSEMEQFMYDFYEASVDAINERDFSIVAGFVTADGPRRPEARKYIDYLDSKGIYQEFYNSKLEKAESIGDNTWEVTTTEEYLIIHPNSSSEQNFRTINNVKLVDGKLLVDELIDTKGID